MTEPDPFDPAALRILARRHGVAPWAEPIAAPAAANVVAVLGPDHVLRVPRDAAFVDDLLREARIVPFARAAGVRTPRMVALDTSGTPFGLPYMIVERVHGSNLTSTAGVGAEVYRELVLRFFAGEPGPAWSRLRPRR